MISLCNGTTFSPCATKRLASIRRIVLRQPHASSSCAFFWYDFRPVNPLIFRARFVLFDWDGTLLNSYAADARAYVAMFRALQIEWDAKEIDRHYSPDWYQVYRAAGIPRGKWACADRLWRRAYRLERPPLLSGARTALRALERKFRARAVVTGGSRARVRRQIHEFGLADHFPACVCSEGMPRAKSRIPRR